MAPIDRLRDLLDRQAYHLGEWCYAYGGTSHQDTRVKLCDKQRGHTDPHAYRSMSRMPTTPPYLCDHCDRQMPTRESGLELFDLHVILCHPYDSRLSDCYRRVTVYHEPLGALRRLEDPPPGVTLIQRGRALT